MLDFVLNNTIYRNKYKTHSDAVIVSCFFNPQQSEYRTKAFKAFYESIKHLNHRIIECVIGDAAPELPETDNIQRVHTPNLLWHKESLLNLAIKNLPPKYKYVFWVDADVLFTNPNWLVDGVKALQENTIIQPFEYCVHLEQDEIAPSFSMDHLHRTLLPNQENRSVWRSFAANFATSDLWQDHDYNNHGHVGFAWAARREVLDQVPLYDRALIGGADHIIAHAAVGQIGHPCITNAFTAEIDSINQWSREFNQATKGKLGFAKGDLCHIWHGAVEKRDYFRRIKGFESHVAEIHDRDPNGLHTTPNSDAQLFMAQYLATREAGLIGEARIFDILPQNQASPPQDQTPQADAFQPGGGLFGGGGASGSWADSKDESNQAGQITGQNPQINLSSPPDTSSRDYTPFS